MHRELTARAARGEGQPPASIPTLHGAIRRDLTPGERAGLAGGERAARKHDVFLARPRPWRNQVWETGHMQAPVLVDVDGHARRPWITWFTDCATNAITGRHHAGASVAGPGTLSAAGSMYEFAPAAEAVLRPLIDGRTVDLATLAETAGLALEDVAGLVQELVVGQAATVGSLL
ncbi:winged helix domain-containing protein [Streptomyces sp. NPDC051104]|uniref:winged helix domain-containing protein n=1 Tax=Streptomyces sp. NPDC051104 TaxID=3155044 RepID=UPI003413CC59